MAHQKVKHLGIIPDGARRWAKQHKVGYYDSYWIAMTKLVDVLDIAFQHGVVIQSVYLLSTENLQRTESDLEPVFATEERLLNELLPNLCDEWNCVVNHAGLKHLLPTRYSEAIDRLCLRYSSSLSVEQRKLYLLIAYNPWEELDCAINSTPNPNNFRQSLWVPESLDLIIRTAYGQLLSNFLPLQSGYAELHFLPKLFNDMEIQDVVEIIENSNRETRLMGT